MSRSNHNKRRVSYSKEGTWARRIWMRRLRAQERAALATERFDDAPKPRKTQGWMTW